MSTRPTTRGTARWAAGRKSPCNANAMQGLAVNRRQSTLHGQGTAIYAIAGDETIHISS